MKTSASFCSLILFSIVTLVGCSHQQALNPQDPYEHLNRNMFKLNTCLDKTVIRPAAVVYNNLIPSPIQTGVTNFFNNLLEPQTFINDLLQGKVKYALVDIGRTVINTTIGVGGVIDVAKHMGLPFHLNDFGKTFAKWTANKKSAFLMIPFLGPSTIRDTIGLPFSAVANPLIYFHSNVVTYAPFAIFYVNLRAQLLPMDKFIADSFDPYAAVRDAYLQYRNAQVIENAEQPDFHFHQPALEEKTMQQTILSGANPVSEPTPLEDFTFDTKPSTK